MSAPASVQPGKKAEAGRVDVKGRDATARQAETVLDRHGRVGIA